MRGTVDLQVSGFAVIRPLDIPPEFLGAQLQINERLVEVLIESAMFVTS